MKYNVQDIIRIVEGEEIDNKTNIVSNILTDSRKVVLPNQSLFVAIKGLHHDGHQYIEDLYQVGVRVFLINKSATIHQHADAAYIIVENSLKALQRLAEHHRRQLNYPIIAITGSNGKTIVKEWLFQLLSYLGKKVVRSPKSYNSQLGVPLSILEFSKGNDLGIVEAGISTVGEMARLSEIIHPDTCIITNVGLAHDEGFEDFIQKTREKARLAEYSNRIIASDRYPILVQQLEANYSHVTQVIFGKEGKYQIVASEEGTVQLKTNKFIYTFSLPYFDTASEENLTHCIIALLELGFKPEAINNALPILAPVSMRLEVKEGINNCKIVDDSYNNDFLGLRLALDFVEQQNFNLKRTLILSDLLQTGELKEV